MAKLTFNSIVYLKSTLEKCYVRAIITIGQKKTYKLSNGMKVGIDELLTELPIGAEVPIEPLQPEQSASEVISTPESQPEQSIPEQPQSQPEHPQSTPNQPQKKAAKKPTKKA